MGSCFTFTGVLVSSGVRGGWCAASVLQLDTEEDWDEVLEREVTLWRSGGWDPD